MHMDSREGEYGAPSVSKSLKITIFKNTVHLVNVAVLEYANAAADI